MRTGARNLITDVVGLAVGSAQDAGLRSGATVVLGHAPMTAGVHVMGGAPGARETELLAPDRLVQQVDAVVLSGGSAFGLDAASGVADGLRAMGRGFAAGPARVPIVPAAILFDLANGGAHGWTANPYRALGAAALEAAGAEVALGAAGAGFGAQAGPLRGGLGSASLVLPCGATVGALVAANPLGAVTVGDGPRFWAAPFEIGEEFGDLGPAPAPPLAATFGDPARLKAGRNTTLAVVATDLTLTKAQATRVAVASHDGFARAIVPAHTPFDGDICFALATGARDEPADPARLMLLGHAAAICVARAIARAVFLAPVSPPGMAPSWRERFPSPRA